MKALMQTAFLAVILFVVACTKTATDDLLNEPVDATQTVVNELLVGTTDDAPIGDGLEIRGGKRHGFGNLGGGRHNHPNGGRGDSIGFAQLPAAAQTYINTNSGGADSVKRMFRVTLPDSTVMYAVRLNNGTHLHFDANGNLVNSPVRGHRFKSLPFDSLPAAAKTHLLTNSDTSKITHIVRVKLQDGSIVYGVRLSDRTHFWFDALGAITAAPPRRRR
jgi:hypothetical protein